MSLTGSHTAIEGQRPEASIPILRIDASDGLAAEARIHAVISEKENRVMVHRIDPLV